MLHQNNKTPHGKTKKYIQIHLFNINILPIRLFIIVDNLN